MDEEELLAESCTSEEDRTLEILTAFLKNQSLQVLTEYDVRLAELALEKIVIGLKEARQKMLTEDDILGVASMQMNSPTVPAPFSTESNSTERISSDENAVDDLDLDYDDYISSGSQMESTRNESVTPMTSYPDCNNSAVSSDSQPENTPRSAGYKEDEENNISSSDFSRSLTREKPFLKMKRFKPDVDISKLNFVYPLGVTFDGLTDHWFITDKIKQTVSKIYVGSDRRKRACSVIKNRLLTTPTAITVLKEGSQVAVLCTEINYKPVIRVIDILSENVTDFCSWKNTDLDFNYPTRGLARSLNGNILTTDRPPNCNPRLRIITKRHQHKTFELKGAEVPSFIASSGSTVVITDLGKEQIVLHIRLDDSDLGNTEFQILRTISTFGVDLKANEMINKQYFMYVAGAQIDRNGNILIADAKNHHFKLFKPTMGFIHRVSTDFPVPYVSSFHVNEHGEVLILGTRNDKVNFAQLSSTTRLEPHIAAANGRRVAVKSYFSKKPSRTYNDNRNSNKNNIKLT